MDLWDARNGQMLCQLPDHENIALPIDAKLVEGSDTDLLIITGSDGASGRLWSYVESKVKPEKPHV